MSATRPELEQSGAAAVAGALATAVSDRGAAVLGVVGGRSVAGVYDALAAGPLSLAWERVHVFVADERCVPVDDPESNWAVVSASLTGPLVASGRMPAANAHPFRDEAGSADHGAAAYAEELAQVGGRFDAVVLSAGEDGHCASLFPHHPALDVVGRSFAFVDGSPKPPSQRITATVPALQTAACAVLLFVGEAKRDALARYRDPALGIADVPCKLVDACVRTVVLTDLD